MHCRVAARHNAGWQQVIDLIVDVPGLGSIGSQND
jgi:hypothetical protein